MSRPVRERLVDLAVDVEQVRLAPAAAVRARGHSRTRRRRAGTAAALVTVAAAAGFGLTSVAGGDRVPVATLPAVPSRHCPIPADLTLPDDPSAVVITVVGGSDKVGQVAVELKQRGFSATIAPEDRGRFREIDPARLIARHVRIRGMVQDYRGRPEIALSNPAQIEILN